MAAPRAAAHTTSFLTKARTSIVAPAALTQRYLQRSFHVSRWDKFKPLTAPKSGKALQRTAGGKSLLDKHKHTVLTVSRYAGSPRRQELAAAFREYSTVDSSIARREQSVVPALQRIMADDVVSEDSVDMEFLALYLNVCLSVGVAPSASVMESFDRFLTTSSDADDEEFQHQAVESVVSAMLHLSKRDDGGAIAAQGEKGASSSSSQSLASSSSALHVHPVMLRRLSKRLMQSSPQELSEGMNCVLLQCWSHRLLHLLYGRSQKDPLTAAAMIEVEAAEEAVVVLVKSLCATSRMMNRSEFLFFVQLARQLVGIELGRALRAGPSSAAKDAPSEGVADESLSRKKNVEGSSSDDTFARALVQASQSPILSALVSERAHILTAALPWVHGASVTECVDLLSLSLLLCRDGTVAQDDTIDLLVHELTALLDLCDMQHIAELLFAFQLTEASGGAACTKRFVKLPGKWKRFLRLAASDEDWIGLSRTWSHSAVECGGDLVAANHKVAFLRNSILE
ncbi:Hypothetical protein, putative [Bodo saltans]|uniref:Uncharacterized protein n=1 Tax=Bodo saltans TaxID=75058 RepID=A0A0S4JQ53_BODSA|nr:Hypothetical protein, putative [Bodo saltans]|eukprot:CUG92320.1 Hypothetical protein, putative [Bodo saltans]